MWCHTSGCQLAYTWAGRAVDLLRNQSEQQNADASWQAVEDARQYFVAIGAQDPDGFMNILIVAKVFAYKV